MLRLRILRLQAAAAAALRVAVSTAAHTQCIPGYLPPSPFSPLRSPIPTYVGLTTLPALTCFGPCCAPGASSGGPPTRQETHAKVKDDLLEASPRRTRAEPGGEIQGLHRQWKARVELRTRKSIYRACTRIQAIWRGLQARLWAHEQRMKKLRVVPTKWAMAQLKKRCQVVRDMGPWQELREPVAGHVFYYFKPTGDSQWDPPKEFEEKFCCTWRNCQRQFNSLLELETHRRDAHWWHCDACFTRN